MLFQLDIFLKPGFTGIPLAVKFEQRFYKKPFQIVSIKSVTLSDEFNM